MYLNEEKNPMPVIDLDEYPDGTEEVLMALWRYEQAQEDSEQQNRWINRRRLAGRISLNKQQVRYRLTRLIEDNYVTRDTVTEHNQRVNYYALLSKGKESARAIGEAKEVLGEIPEEITRQDLLKLTNEIAAIRAEIEVAGLELDDIKESKFKNKLDECRNGIEYNYDRFEMHEKDIESLWRGVDRIYEKFGWDKIEPGD
jgi:DNA-binding MarR family transcriptional regulator